MEAKDVARIGSKVEEKFKVKVTTKKHSLMIDVPVKFGFATAQDKIELVEDLTAKIVEYIRTFDVVFDVMCDITYETIHVKFIG